MIKFAERLMIAMASVVVFGCAARAQSAEEFFRKTPRITMYVGSDAGGGYDVVARFVARHLPRFLPGHPEFVIENMPTAHGVQANNFVYNSAPKDGSVVLAAANSALALPIFDSPVAHYDPRKFEWIGSTGKQQAICVTWKSSEIRTLDDAKKREVTVSSTAVNAAPGIYPTLLNSMLGTKFKVIPGYSTGGMLLAVERGEVDGLCGYAWQAYLSIGSNWFSEGKVNVLGQMGLEKNSDLPNVPLINDLFGNSDDKQVFDLIQVPQEFGRPFVAPPGTPLDRMTVYRNAFETMLKDPEFLAEAKAQRIVLEPTNYKDVESLLDRAFAAPAKIRDRAKIIAAQMN
jgi:tripartite-type tricarboxylate transporter receptor subunit TctC